MAKIDGMAAGQQWRMTDGQIAAIEGFTGTGRQTIVLYRSRRDGGQWEHGQRMTWLKFVRRLVARDYG